MKKNHVLVASTRNWCTKALSSYFTSKGFDCFTISADSSFGDVSLRYFFWPVRLLKKLWPKPYYECVFNVIECYIFDLLVCIFILIRRPRFCLLWSGMSSNSVRVCKFLNIKSCLWVGEEYLGHSKSRGVLQARKHWLNEIDKALNFVDIVLVESTFVLKTLPDVFREKTHVVFSPVSSKFLDLGQEIPYADGRSIKLGIIGSTHRKNTGFAVDIANQVAKDQNCELHVFGDLEFFENGLSPPPKFKLALHEYFHEEKSYIEALQKVDVYLFPSKSDAGPRSLVEVAALGIQSIVSTNSIGPDLLKFFPNVKVSKLDKDLWVAAINEYQGSKNVYEISSNSRQFQCEQNDRMQTVCDFLCK